MAGSLGASIEELCEIPTGEAPPALEALKQILGNVVENPAAVARWSSDSLKGKQLCALPHIAKCLRAAGFSDDGGALLLPAGMADVPVLRESLDLIECLLSTMEVEPEDKAGAAAGKDSSAPMEVDDDMDPDLAEAMKLSMGEEAPGSSPEAKRARQESAEDAAVAARLAEEEEKHVDVEFERFRGEDVLITDEAVMSINKYCAECAEQYVDPQFPPVSRSLYINESDGETWECFRCHSRTKLPPVPPMATSQEEAAEREEEFLQVKCSGCGEKAPFVVKTRYFNRPVQWLRPGVSCQSCTAMAPYEYPGMRDPSTLIEIMCTHYLRSKATMKTLGQPWKVIRDQPRPEDVQQGGLGNCWMAAALSIVASKPDLIWSLFITREFNPHGAYQMQLFHAGDWRGILIDDLFPTSQCSPGKIVGEMVHYSRGGNLSYMSCARQQLWVPMVEKAAAKLAGSYGNLSSGTFGEALASFTGFPTERLILYISKEQRKARAEMRDKKIAQRTEMLLRGETPPEEDEEDLMLDDNYRNDMLWSKLLSFKEAGYLMGMGCTEQGCEKSKDEVLEKGLQAPHAYGILDVRELEHDGKIHRLVQIRNPWGEDAPRTWKGAFGKDWDGWTFDLKLKLGVVNRSNVSMYDQMSIFWMPFDDVKEFFAMVDVCRVHDSWEEYSERAWLPSGVGPGEAFDLTVYGRTQVDIALWQEKHITRESAVGGSTNVDVGLLVLRKLGENEDGTPEFEKVEYIKRCNDDCISQEMILEGGFVYRIAPLCFNQMQQTAPRRVTVVVHASNPVKLQKVPSCWRDLACASVAAASSGKVSSVMPGIKTMVLQERVGYVFAIENDTDSPFGLQVDSMDSIGYVSSKEGGSCGCIDLVPPRSRKLVLALAVKQGVGRTALSFAFEGLPPEAAAWAVGAEDVHMALPLTPLARQSGKPQADSSILQATPPERMARPLSARGGQRAPDKEAMKILEEESAEAEEALAEALRMSLEENGGCAAPAIHTAGEGKEEEDDLADAIALSMVQAPQEPAAPEQAAAASQSTTQSGDMKQLVKDLFEEYRKQGLTPNDAAVKAMAEAKARRASSGSAAASSAAAVSTDRGVGDSGEMKQLVQQLFEEYRKAGVPPNEAAAKAMQEAKARLSSN